MTLELDDHVTRTSVLVNVSADVLNHLHAKRNHQLACHEGRFATFVMEAHAGHLDGGDRGAWVFLPSLLRCWEILESVVCGRAAAT